MEASGGNAMSDMRRTVSYRSSRNKSQGVYGSGEPEGVAKANARTAREARRAKARGVTSTRPEANVIYS